MNSRIVILPLGSWEQHGAHLPPTTDTVIIEEVVRQSVVDSPEFIVAPSIAISASDEHGGFTHTLSTGTEPLVSAVVAIARSASWSTGVCIVNGHGGNADALVRIHSALEYENVRHGIWSLPSYEGADMHAGKTETSVMLHIAPHLVDISLAQPGALGKPTDIIPAMRVGGMKAVSENGVLGDPTQATQSHGAEVMNMYVSSLTTYLQSLSQSWG